MTGRRQARAGGNSGGDDMAYFDLAVGLAEAAADDLVFQYYANPPSSDNPFKQSKSLTIKGFGEITISWDITQAPTIVYGPPTQSNWDAALDSTGATNQSAHNPLPTGDVIQVVISDMTAHYTQKGSPPVGGDAKNVTSYLKVNFSGGAITLTPVAILVDESSFKAWDKLVFNGAFIPEIFKQVHAIGSVVHVPDLSWHGVSLETPVFKFFDDLLVAATVQSGSKDPVDFTGATWPVDPMFALASRGLLNSAAGSVAAGYDGVNHSDNGKWKDLATWSYSATLQDLTAAVSSISPLEVALDVKVQLKAGGGLTAAGMALAALGCALGAAVLV